MKLLQQAGLSRIHVGLESGDDTILKRIKKGTNAAEQIQAGQIVKQAGIQLSDHYTNYLNLSGKLPQDKDRLLEAVNQALTWDPSSFRPNFIGTQ